MERFLQRHHNRIEGVVSGFDRLVFRGTWRSISYQKGLDRFLASQRVLYKDFGTFAQRVTARVRAHAEALARETGRPLQYLPSSATSKDDVARAMAARDGVTEGLICILACVEPCRSFSVRGDRQAQRLRLVAEERKCTHWYFYFVDRDFGLMYVRLQSWVPLAVQVGVNGREWLARQLARAGGRFTQRGNCVLPENAALAATCSARLATYPWERWLRRYVRLVNPWCAPETGVGAHYYWSARASEWASDVIFATAADLQAVYPRVLQHAITHFQTADVLRFLGRVVPGRFQGEAHSTLVHRPEGVRIRHWLDENSIKMYDKADRVLRIEMTLNNPDRFKVLRRRPSDGRRDWLPLRRGIADLGRRAELGRAAVARYLDALSVVGDGTPSHRLLDPVSHRITRNGRPYRPLRPISPQEAPLFASLLRGEFALRGFDNRAIRQHLYPDDESDAAARRRTAARVTRHFRLLRAHRLIKKVGRTHYYRLTDRGHHVMTTALGFRQTNLAVLAA
jgi:hypothetical protein